MQPTPITMVGSADFYTYAYLLNGANSLFKSAKEHPLGSNYCRVAAVVFSAFAIEACLNHIGEGKLRFWSIVERTLSWESKLELIAQYLDVQIDKGKRPFQTLTMLFKLRNHLAHGRTQTVEGTYKDSDDPDHVKGKAEVMDPDWLNRLYSDDEVQRVLEDTTSIVELFLERAGFDPRSWRLSASGMYYEKLSTTPNPPNSCLNFPNPAVRRRGCPRATCRQSP